MNPFQLSLLLVLLPVALQTIIGSLALTKKLKLHFGLVSLFCSLLLFVMIYVGLGFVSDDANKQGVRCGMPNAAFFFYGVIMLIAQLAVIIIQSMVKKVKKL